MTRFDPATLEILWQRLIGISNEMATVLVNTSFSTVIAAANDFACEIMDAEGRSLAHATRSMPVFNQTIPHVTAAVLAHFGDDVRPGDVYITNDPWLNAGHHPDIAVITPFFRHGRPIGIAASVAHAADIGGTLDVDRARESFEEGLMIPITRLYREGEVQQPVVDFIRGNVRVPDAVMGDIHAQVAANKIGVEKSLSLLDEYSLDDLSELAATIQERSERAMRNAITAVPDGTYRSHVQFNEFDAPLRIECAVTIDGDEVRVDYSGTSPQQPQGGLNCTNIYTRSQTSYGLKCVLLPEVPSNAGVYRSVRVHAPEGSVLNARKPAAVEMRTRTGWYVHHALFSALADVLDRQVMAPTGLMSAWIVYGQDQGGETFHSWFFNAGGMGAGSETDGVSARIYPSSASGVSVELFEVAAPVLVNEKALRTDSGGAGKQRGGLGQQISMSVLPGHEESVTISQWVHSLDFQPFGLHGGGAGAAAEVIVNNQAEDRDQGERSSRVFLDSADTEVTQLTAGGGGFGAPGDRDRELVVRDMENGYISIEQARDVYGLE